VTPPTAQERADIREDHYREDWPGEAICGWCSNPWPCRPIRLLDSLEAAEAVLWRLVTEAERCSAGVAYCYAHGYHLPCPVGEARAWLERQREGK
jgi:hypothetical protein